MHAFRVKGILIDTIELELPEHKHHNRYDVRCTIY